MITRKASIPQPILLFLTKTIGLFCWSLFLVSCEETIEIELPTSEPRLVIDALIGLNSNSGIPITFGQVTLSLTAPYLDAETPPATGAQVSIINEMSGERFELTENTPGVFNNGFPDLMFGVDYSLEVIYQGETFRATEQLSPTGVITNIEQGDGFLFDEEEETEIIITFDDIPEQRNHYIFVFGRDNYLVTDDEFYQDGSLTFSYFYENIEPNELLRVTLIGVNKRFADFVEQAIVQSGENSTGPFQVPVGNVRGNIVNTSNSANFAFGYFAIGEFETQTLRIE